jgi:aryl-alcohol dehydrogenase-like predicted oxidoreductase
MYRYLGINTHSKSELEFVSRHSEIFSMVLLDYNVIQLDREPLIDDLNLSGVGVVAGTVLAQGHLAKGKIGSLKNGSLKNGSFFWYLARSLLKPTSRRLADASKGMRDALSSVTNMSPAQAAFSYILANKKISSCVFGTTNISNCLEILESTDKQPSPEEMLAIKNAFMSSGMIISS